MKIKPVLAALAAAFTLFSWLVPAVYAAAPAAISYQATLRKNGALFNGTAAMEFRIASSDLSTIYWTSGSTDVVVSAGLFRYALGSPGEAAFAAIRWGDIAPYVQMKVDGGWLPPEPLYSSAYSLHASRAEGSSGSFTAYDGNIRISTTSGSKGLVFQDGSEQYTASGWTVSGSDAYTTFSGNAGVGVASPQARLDVQGVPAAQYTQIWRNEFGVIKASMTASGMLYADGSLMRNMPTGADGLGNHTANRDLDIAGYNVVNVSSISGYGQALRVGSDVWMMNSRFGLGTNAPAAQLHISTSAGSYGDLLVISTGIAKVIRMTGAGAIYATKYYGDGSGLAGVTGGGGADNLGNHTLTQNLVTGSNWISNDGSSKGLNLDTSGNVGLGETAGSARLDVRGAVGNYIQLWRNASGVIQASMTVLGAISADGSQLRNVPAGGTATRALDMASFNINSVSTVTAGYLSSPGAGVVFTTNALVMGGKLGIDTQAPQEKLHVQGKILSSYLSGSGNRCVYADNSGVLRLSVDNCGLAGVNGDQLGLHVMSQNLIAGSNWISGDGANEGLRIDVNGNVSVTDTDYSPSARLDVRGSVGNYIQVWRDSGGIVQASMTAAGLLYADASNLRNLPLGADNLGSHTAAQALNMAGSQIQNVSSLTVTGASGAGAPRLYLAQNAELSSTTAARYGGVYVSTHIYIADGAKYYGDGSGLSGITGVADNLGDHTATQNLNLALKDIAAVSTITAAYLTSTGPGVIFSTNALILGGRLGIDTQAPQEKLHVNGYILSSPLASGANRCAYVDPNGVIRAKGSDCGTAAGAADDLGSHVMIQPLNTNNQWISGDNSPAGLTVAVTGNVGIGIIGAATRLDVMAAGDGYAQFWRNSFGTIVASMTSAGLLYADGSGIRNVPSDNLGSHTASQDLNLASHDIINVSTITAGYLTSPGAGVVFSTNIIVTEGNIGINTYVPQERLHVNGNILSSNLAGASNRCVYVDVNGVLHAKGSDCGLASPTGDDLGSHVMAQNLATGSSWLSGDGNNEGLRIDGNGNVTVTDTLYTPSARLDVRGAVGNYIQVWRSAAGVIKSSMSVDGVLYGDGSGLRNLPSLADNMGSHIMTKDLATATKWISVDGTPAGIYLDLANNIGVGHSLPVTRLDIKSAALDVYSQIWRDSGGTIVASMTAAGQLYADASKLRNVPSSEDSLGSHIATTTLQMAGFDIRNAAAITASGQVTSYSSITVAGAAGLGSANLRLSPGVEISSTTAEQQGGLFVSSNVYLAGGARYYGEGSGLTDLNASVVSSGILPEARLSANVPRLDSDQYFTGVNTFASSLTVTSASGVGAARFRLNSNVEISSATAANNGGVYISTNVRLAAGAKYYGDGSSLSNIMDSLGSHIATMTFSLGGNSIINAASGTFTQGITASSFTAAGTGLAAAQLRFNSSPNLVISSETSPAFGAGVRVSTNIYVAGFVTAAKFYGNASGMTGLPATGDNLGSHIATMTLSMDGNSIVNAASGTFTQGITASSFTALGAGLAAAQLRFNSSPNLVISSETSPAFGAGVRVSTNVYIVGFASATAYFGNGSMLTGLPSGGDSLGSHIATSTLNMGGNSIVNAASGTFAQGITASSFTASGVGLTAAQLRFNPSTSSNLVISSETNAAFGAGVRVSTNVYIVGFSSAARYYGNGAGLTGVTAPGAVQKTGDTMTGQLTLNGSTLTITDADANTNTSGLRFGNFACTGSDKLTANASGIITCAADIAGGGGATLGQTLINGNDAGGLNIVNIGAISANGQLTTYSSATVTSALGVGAAQVRFNPSGGIVISSETNSALGGGVRVSTNVYIVGFSSASRYYGDGSALTGISIGGSVLKTGDTMTGQLTTYSSVTVTSALGVEAVRLSINPNVNISSALPSNYGGLFISTHVFLPFGAKYYGDGSSLEGVGTLTTVQKTGDTMTGQLTLNGSTLTIRDAGGGSGLRFGNFGCTGSDKLTADANGVVSCAVDVAGGGGANIGGVLTVGNNAANIDIINLGGITANGQVTTYSSATVVGNIKNSPLAGAGDRCVFANASGVLGVKGVDCGTGGGGGPESCVNPNNASDELVQVGDFCVDKYEATIWNAVTGGTKFGANIDDYLCSDNGSNCSTAGATKIFARSVPNEVPSSSMTWFQANAACVNSGKHLITNAEWQAAVVGTPDPGGSSGIPACNTNGVSTNQTGSGTGCRSIYDIENMVGSLWEWVAEWGIYSPGMSFWNATYNDDLGGGPSGAPIAGMIRGGAYDSVSTVAGSFSFNTTVPPFGAAATVGFRCAMRLR